MKRTVTIDGPEPVDVHVGQRIRLRRSLLGFSQSTLADKLGLTFQQVQKYERGGNRVSASKLWKLAEILDVPVSFFFDDMAGTEPAKVPTMVEPDIGTRDMHFLRALRTLDPAVQKQVYDLLKTLARLEGTADEALARVAA